MSNNHHTSDYKLNAVKYYLNNDTTLRETCYIFNCSKSSLQRWIIKYEKYKNFNRIENKSKPYKITKEIETFILDLTKKYVNITLYQLRKQVKNKFKIN